MLRIGIQHTNPGEALNPAEALKEGLQIGPVFEIKAVRCCVLSNKIDLPDPLVNQPTSLSTDGVDRAAAKPASNPGYGAE